MGCFPFLEGSYSRCTRKYFLRKSKWRNSKHQDLWIRDQSKPRVIIGDHTHELRSITWVTLLLKLLLNEWLISHSLPVNLMLKHTILWKTVYFSAFLLFCCLNMVDNQWSLALSWLASPHEFPIFLLWYILIKNVIMFLV